MMSEIGCRACSYFTSNLQMLYLVCSIAHLWYLISYLIYETSYLRFQISFLIFDLSYVLFHASYFIYEFLVTRWFSRSHSNRCIAFIGSSGLMHICVRRCMYDAPLTYTYNACTVCGVASCLRAEREKEGGQGGLYVCSSIHFYTWTSGCTNMYMSLYKYMHMGWSMQIYIHVYVYI